MSKRVMAAMSGGVDSSLVAAVLMEQGYEVIGVTMSLGETSRQAVEDAKIVAEYLGIEHYVADFETLFKETVIGSFLSEYAAGRTPNPCVICNEHVKFGGLIRFMHKLGCDYMATGHYARVIYDNHRGRYAIQKGRDEHKDQSYMLYRLGQDILKHLLLPLGNFTKQDTRQLSREKGLPVAEKPESQDICFIQDNDYKRFIKENNPGCLKPGEITDTSGRILGRHDGLPLYTIGQRKGMGIAAAEPLYVARLDTEENRVIAGTAAELFSSSFTASGVKWQLLDNPGESFEADIKVRYGNRMTAGRVNPLGHNRVRVELDTPVRAITPGQSAVFYIGDLLAGGGFID